MADDNEPYCARCRSFCNGTNALCECCNAGGVPQRHVLAEDVIGRARKAGDD